MTTAAADQRRRYEPDAGTWLSADEDRQRNAAAPKTDPSSKWDGWIKKACATSMIMWTLAAVGPKTQAPTDVQHDASHHRRGTASATIIPGARSHEMRTAARDAVADARRAELNTILDSMLVTQRVKPGTPFEERSGHIPNDHVRAIAKKIDDRLGGRIEWPNIHLVDGLTRNSGARGHHRDYGGGDTAPKAANDKLVGGAKFGISLDKDLVEREILTGEPHGISIEALLIHEVQHATSHDNGERLYDHAEATGDVVVSLPPEDMAVAAATMTPVYSGTPTSESRAGMAMILNREIESRERLEGPRLNELPTEDRRAAVSAILMQYVENHHDQERNEAELLQALKSPKYIYNYGDENTLPNPIWKAGPRVERTVAWAKGLEVVGHRPTASGLIEHIDSMGTDLQGMAERWKSGRSHRPYELAEPGPTRDEQLDRTIDRLFTNRALAQGPVSEDRLPRPVVNATSRAETPATPAARPEPPTKREDPSTPETRVQQMTEEAEALVQKMQEQRPEASRAAPGAPGAERVSRERFRNGPHDHPAEQDARDSRGATSYQRYEIKPRDKPDPRETGLRVEATYEDEIKREVDAILDSMLITERVPPGTPFEERIGIIPNDHVRGLMKEIDDNLGGRIEWPNVFITDELSQEDALGQYRAYIGAEGATVPETVNREEPPDEKFGITIRQDVYDATVGKSPAMGISLKAVLVHELQHATSSDNARELRRIARENGWPYERNAHATAEGRADIAILVEREIDARRDVGGPKLNEMDPAERRDAISQIIGGYIGVEPDHPEHVRDAKLLLALRDPAYLASGKNLMWRQTGDARTNDYVYGRDQSDTFVPSHSTPEEREIDLRKPLNELAADWRNAGSRDARTTRAGVANLQAPARDTPPTKTTAPAAPTAPADRAADRTPTTGTRTPGNLKRPTEDGATRSPDDHDERSNRPASRAAAPEPGRDRQARPATPAQPATTGARAGKTRPAAKAEGGPEPAAPRAGDKTRQGPEAEAESPAKRMKPTSTPRQTRPPQTGAARLRLLLHARHRHAPQTAARQQEHNPQARTGSAADNLAPPSGRYSSGSRHTDKAPVRGVDRAVGGGPAAGRREQASREAATR